MQFLFFFFKLRIMSLKKNPYLCIWLHWVLVSAHRIFVGVHELFSCCSWTPECAGTVVAGLQLSFSAACGTLVY